MTYRGKYHVHHGTVSPHLPDPNQGRNECCARGNCCNEVEEKHEMGPSLRSVHSMLNLFWPVQVCKFDAALELILDSGCWVEREEGSFV